MTCDACTLAATDPNCGHYRADCEQCTVRAVATSPQHIREAEYRLCEPEDLPAFKAAVKAEHERIKALQLSAT